MQVLAVLFPLVLRLDDINQQPPKDDDVVAGWTAFVVFLLLLALVAFLGWSLSRQLKKVRAAKEAGVFGEDEREESRELETAPRDTSSDQAAGETPEEPSKDHGNS